MDYNPARKSLGNFLTKIIRVMQNIGFTTSQDSTTIAPENLGATVDKMDNYFRTICSGVSNGVFISIERKHALLLSG